ncbi:restriction endonuclease subunit S [Pararhizobium sp. BT-229]|uniref:restriction endonuclease subunit S n=1 Tax=Pararhizobium sp. BT-229 TaxID=2986923 RepID=UPI0021F6D69A|nr:restriction endonuclease subunit S [Pararhizobium sp. BT-229]MCV9962702.1 restriction endonuclease subunit S [Pararhizobium sp. BT-229]
MSVRTARLGDIADDLRSGFACGLDDPAGVIQFRMNNVERDGSLNWSKTRRVPTDMVKNGLTLQAGDILLNATNSPELVGKTALFVGADEPITFSNHFLRLRTKAEVAEPAYLARWLRRQFELGNFKAMCRSWVNQASITRDQVSNLEFPLPPLDEQKRIAAILDKADQLRQKRRQAIALLDSLTQSIFLEMFGDPVSNPRAWPEFALGEVLAEIESGWSPSCLDRQATPSEWGVLKLSAVTSGQFVETEQKALPQELEARPRIEVRQGDVLFTRKNTYDLVAACALVKGVRPKLMLSDLIFRLVIRDNRTLLPTYLWACLSNPRLRSQIQLLAGGAAGSMPNISKEKLRGFRIPVPKIEIQRVFADRANKAFVGQAHLGAHNQQIDTLFASLQHRAFSGQL